MSTNNICFHKENQKKKNHIIKYALFQFPAYLSGTLSLADILLHILPVILRTFIARCGNSIKYGNQNMLNKCKSVDFELFFINTIWQCICIQQPL